MGNQKKTSATLEKRKKAFEDQCYEVYKFWWSMSRRISQLKLLETVSDLNAKETLRESRDAFLKNEFLDQRYMDSLFNMMGMSDSLRKFYTNHYIKPTGQPILAPYWVTIKVDGR